MKKENAPFKKIEQSAKDNANFTIFDGQLHLPGFEFHPAVPVKWPRKHSQRSIALCRLLEGEELRQDVFHNSWRLAAIVHALAKMGWVIISRMVFSQSRGRLIAAYKIDLGSSIVQAALRLRNNIAGRKGAAC